LSSILPLLGPGVRRMHRLRRPRQLRDEHRGGAKYGYLLLWVILAANLMGC
jgi:Mn2+/Fe2+ NRAMP family transporter